MLAFVPGLAVGQADCVLAREIIPNLGSVLGEFDTIAFLSWEEESSDGQLLLQALFSRNVQVAFLDSASSQQSLEWLGGHISPRALIVPAETADLPFLVEASEMGLMEQHAWLVPEPLNSSALQLRLDSQLFTYGCEGIGDVTIKEVYAAKSVHYFENDIAMWNVSAGVMNRVSSNFMWERRANLSGVPLINTANPWDEFYKIRVDGISGM